MFKSNHEKKHLLKRENEASYFSFNKLVQQFNNLFYSDIYSLIKQNNYQQLKTNIQAFIDKNDKQGLIKYVNQYNPYYSTPLHWAIRVGAYNERLTCIKLLLENGADPDFMEDDGLATTPLYLAAVSCRNAEMSALLIKYGANLNKPVNTTKKTPLQAAPDIIKEAKKINIDDLNSTIPSNKKD